MLIKMKKKLLFIIPEYSIGGTNTSLKNLLSFIDKDRYEISIYCLYEDGGQYFKDVFEPYVLQKSHLYYWLHDNVFTRKFMGIGMKISKRINFNWLYKREVAWLQKKYKFDIVIGFQEGVSTTFTSYFSDVKRIAWFHSPYVDFVKDIRAEYLDVYMLMDAIMCVSHTFVKMFVGRMPELDSKTYCMYNTLNNAIIRSMSNEPLDESRFDQDRFSIVSIGRFAKQKQFEYIPRLVNEINTIGVKRSYRWYMIVSGDECKEETEREIQKYNLENQVIILGAKDNPYPLLRASDLYVCTSLTESFSYTIAESKLLHTPVVSNDFPVAYEVVDNSVGWICNINEMAPLIADIINDRDGMYSQVKSSISGYDYDNEEILSEFYRLL